MSIWQKILPWKRKVKNPQSLQSVLQPPVATVDGNLKTTGEAVSVGEKLVMNKAVEELLNEIQYHIEQKNYTALASINSHLIGGQLNEYYTLRNVANRALVQAGKEAVNSILRVLQITEVGMVELAKILVDIGDERAVPTLVRLMERGVFNPNPLTKTAIREFLEKHIDMQHQPEVVTCSYCGKTVAITQAEYYLVEGNLHGQVKWFCVGECWNNRSLVLKNSPQQQSPTVQGIIICPYCGKRLLWEPKEAGQRATCPFCKEIFIYPT